MADTQYAKLNTLKTGLKCRCPRCGEGPLFQGYLTIRKSCPVCDLDYGFAEPADGPAFFVMSITGLIGMVGLMIFDFAVKPPIWVHFITTLPLVCLLCLGILRPLKGWMIAEQYFHKAEEAKFLSIGKHGEGYGWRGQAEKAARKAEREKTKASSAPSGSSED